ncbi:MAG: FAD-dependent oxidoreductase, partial [Pyrinomonadaceae bacterium]
YGMAEYKMPQSVSLSEVEHIKKIGVEFKTNTEIVGDTETPGQRDAANESEPPAVAGGSTQTSFKELEKQHDAIFLGVGLGETNKLNIPGENLAGVYDALDFIEKIKTRDWTSVPLGKSVAVIGAGNTAIDAVTQAKRLGAAKVMMVYRRTEKDASAYHYELELAKKDGVEFVWQAAPIGILADDGDSHVTSLRCEKTDGSLELFEIKCYMVIKATGQQKMRGFFETVVGVEVDDKGRVVVNDQMQTSNPTIFSGGDCANGGKEAVDASQMGKYAAQGIHLSLSGETVKFAGALH